MVLAGMLLENECPLYSLMSTENAKSLQPAVRKRIKPQDRGKVHRVKCWKGFLKEN
jgi:hypothetical protein